jgi:hypothetical protein
VDNDGDVDVIGCSVKNDEVMWWENDDGSGTLWIKHFIDGTFTHGRFVTSADVNSDGAVDILGAADIESRLSWWALSSFSSPGILVSSVLDVAERPEWQYIDWTCSEPGLTSIAFQVRASDDPANMGAWSDTLDSPDSLSAILDDGDSLFQYKAILKSDYSYSTPVLHSVSVFWERITGFGESPNYDSHELRGALPNPSSGPAMIEFSIPRESLVELTVYDVSGRVVSRTEDNYSAGTHQLEVSDVASGVYLVRMRAGEFTATRRFVVIE